MSIRPERLLVLAELERGPADAAEIAERIGMLQPLVDRLLDLLVMQGLAEEESAAEGTRLARFRITPSGRSILDSTEGPLS